jgi:hypothetical protein
MNDSSTILGSPRAGGGSLAPPGPVGPVPEEKGVILDPGWDGGDTDPLGLFKDSPSPGIVELIVDHPPVSFPTWDTLAPDGWGESLSIGVVREPLSGDVLDGYPGAKDVLGAALAVARQQWGEGLGGEGGWPGPPLGTADALAWPAHVVPPSPYDPPIPPTLTGPASAPHTRLLELAAWDAVDDGTPHGHMASANSQWIKYAVDVVRGSVAHLASVVEEEERGEKGEGEGERRGVASSTSSSSPSASAPATPNPGATTTLSSSSFPPPPPPLTNPRGPLSMSAWSARWV